MSVRVALPSLLTKILYMIVSPRAYHCPFFGLLLSITVTVRLSVRESVFSVRMLMFAPEA